VDEQKLRILDEAKSLSYSGFSKDEIMEKLSIKDLDTIMRKYVIGVIDDAQIDLEMKKQIKESGLNKMIFGIFVFLLGLGITYVYYKSKNIAFYIMIGMILGGPYVAYIGYKEYSTPIEGEVRLREQRIKKSKFSR